MRKGRADQVESTVSAYFNVDLKQDLKKNRANQAESPVSARFNGEMERERANQAESGQSQLFLLDSTDRKSHHFSNVVMDMNE